MLKVQVRAAADDRQHTELAGTTTKRPAAPLVRDEEAAMAAGCIAEQEREQQYYRTAPGSRRTETSTKSQAMPKDRTDLDDLRHGQARLLSAGP